MNRNLLLACVLLLFVTPFGVVAQDNPEQPEPDPDIELMKLFTVEGRSWSYKVIEWTRGESPYVVNENITVTEVDTDEDNYYFERNSHSANGTSESAESSYGSLNPTEQQKWYADNRLPVVSLDMGFREFDCRKHHEEDIDGSQVTTWVSTEFHPLIVKQTRLGKTATHIRKLTGFITAETDPYLLYRKEGRSWTHKSTTTLAGMDPMVSYTRQTVTEVGDDYAMLQMEILDKDKEPMAGMVNLDPTRIEFIVVSAPVGGLASTEFVYENKECEAGEFECIKTEMSGSTSWSSSVWPGLSVGFEMETTSMELVEFDLGHDRDKFYRTEGNYYETNHVVDAGIMKIEIKQRWEVKSVDETGADYELISYDQNGNEASRFDMRHDFREREDGDPLMRYTGQTEELISTPAGNFPCIYTDSSAEGAVGETSVWMWNGIMVRTVTSSNGTSSELTLAKLNIQ